MISMQRKISKGDLVHELPLGRDWFRHNPVFKQDTVGIVIEVVDDKTVFVMWSNGTTEIKEDDNLELIL